jgi:lysophospholipase L1-like esterase
MFAVLGLAAILACGDDSTPSGAIDAARADDAGASLDAGGIGDAGSLDGGGTRDAGTDAGAPATAPIAALDSIALAIIVGDSIAAGYDARGRNDTGGRGYARQMVDAHPDFPAFAGHDLSTHSPGVDFRRVAESGATSGDALGNLRDALGGGLPRAVDGDVVVMIHAGGNDFNDSILTIISATETARVAAQVRANVIEMMRLLRERYADEAAGKEIVFLVDNIHDPTDGMGTVPSEFREGFCATIRDPRFIPALRMAALENLATMNAAIAEAVAADPDAHLVDFHAGFLGHGMNSGADRYVSDDCVHPTDEGHSHLRALAWQVLTGEAL